MQRVGILVIVLLAVAVWRVKDGLVFLTLTEFPAGYYSNGDWGTQCESVKRVPDATFRYCEDAVFWDHLDGAGALESRFVVVSCDPGRKSWNTVMGPLRNPKPHGGLWIYSPGPKAQPRRISLMKYPRDHDFHPLGFDIYPSANGRASTMFVVNHARQRTVIEQFSISPTNPIEATWIRTLSSPYFVAPNSIAMTSTNSFYVTNDHLMTRRLPQPFASVLPMMETVLSLPVSWAAHVVVDNENGLIDHSFAAIGIPFPNGIAVSPDGSVVSIASSSGGKVFTYSRDASNNKLAHRDTVPLPFAPDNLSYDDTGALLVTGHPHFPSVINVASNRTGATAPSWVVAISPRKHDLKAGAMPTEFDMLAPVSASSRSRASQSHEIETLFQSNGSLFSTSTTGIRDSRTGHLFIVGLYDEQGMLLCSPQN